MPSRNDTCCSSQPHDHAEHSHGDEDSAHGHDHSPEVTDESQRRVFWVMMLTGGFMVAEAAGGLLSGSLALLADAGHMLTDTAALALAWFAFRIARKESDPLRSYGYHRFQVLAAFVNGLALFAIAAWIVIEAIGRLVSPVTVMGTQMLVIAALGLLVNLVAFAILHRGERGNLNLQGALLHVMGDLLGSVAAIVAAVVIMQTGWTPIDPILSVVVAVLILRSAWTIVAESAHILLEGSPDGIDQARIGAALKAGVPEIQDVHHVHAWSLTSERPLVTLHALVTGSADHNRTIASIRQVLSEKFGVQHVTVQVERERCAEVELA